MSHEHCLVQTGYDKNARTVSVADPLRGNVTYDLDLVVQRYNQMGKQAVLIHATTDSKTEAEGVLDNGVYRLRNAGSGLYMTDADGIDADERNLNQDAADGTAAQEFRISYDTDRNAYRLYTMCSSGETNRVVDIVKLGGSVVSGSKQKFIVQWKLLHSQLFSFRRRTERCCFLAVRTAVHACPFGIQIQEHKERLVFMMPEMSSSETTSGTICNAGF